ncbi:glucan biosynthesis protein [Pseudogemmobacter blasticus]|uniref:Glucan biosynthesis protein D n=1 Tax=Fuscovulum blasticum DSM 2131 TaxID=1188250 RepID=A0A2T4JA06_FUSBL|nr:glucan biosynthesis protein D [Fuscovulum blasticum]PTE14721.1 glucan biosynthesis protein D [Fuscovulum blasticum DSM 2131]
MPPHPHRRDILRSALGAGAFFLLPRLALAQTGSPAAEPTPFTFEILKEMARTLAAHPYEPAKIEDDAVLEQVDYDAHNQISFRKDRTLWLNSGDMSPVQPFFPGRYFRQPVRIFTLEGGMATEFPFALDLFDIPEGNPARNLTHTHGFAGFRVQDAKSGRDWMAFLGASYWRTEGYSGQFGLSVRGLAMDTALANGPEEFPLFTRFWLEPSPNGEMTAYALLESPRATGAYRIASRRDKGVIQDVEATIFLRGTVERLGIAPLTSMFWFNKTNRFVSVDWRPEVHDSDGLEILSASGETIWRPLNAPPRNMVNTFSTPGVRGFGLMQRERDFAQYQDDGVFYDRRASAWVEPKGDWGNGTVTLVELHTEDETHDNIVAFWQPATPAVKGATFDMAYRLSWVEDCPVAPTAARFIATRIGAAGMPGEPRPENAVKLVCDFDGRGLEGLGPTDGVTLEVTASHGKVDKTAAFPVVGQSYWRGIFDLDFSMVPPGDDTPMDLRLFVSHKGAAKSETMLLQLFPSQMRKLLDAAP